jgi:hypothetical protein
MLGMFAGTIGFEKLRDEIPDRSSTIRKLSKAHATEMAYVTAYAVSPCSLYLKKLSRS